MSDETLGRPFTAEELDKAIISAEEAFRKYYRAAGLHFLASRLSDCTRCHTDAAETASILAETASILAELRYQRERIT